MRIRFFLTIFIACMILGIVPVAAQDGAPVIDAPDPSLCTLRPLTVSDLQRILSEDWPPIETPTPVSDPFVMPTGEELFTHERNEVEKDIRRVIACVNTGEPLKALAGYTDRWIANFLAEQGGLTDALIAGLQVDRDLQREHYLQILEFGAAVQLPDDRVAIVVRGIDPSDGAPARSRLFLMSEVKPGRFLVDEVITIPE